MGTDQPYLSKLALLMQTQLAGAMFPAREHLGGHEGRRAGRPLHQGVVRGDVPHRPDREGPHRVERRPHVAAGSARRHIAMLIPNTSVVKYVGYFVFRTFRLSADHVLRSRVTHIIPIPTYQEGSK